MLLQATGKLKQHPNVVFMTAKPLLKQHFFKNITLGCCCNKPQSWNQCCGGMKQNLSHGSIWYLLGSYSCTSQAHFGNIYITLVETTSQRCFHEHKTIVKTSLKKTWGLKRAGVWVCLENKQLEIKWSRFGQYDTKKAHAASYAMPFGWWWEDKMWVGFGFGHAAA